MKRLFFISGQYLGFSPIPANRPCEHSILWYCSACGEVYARMPVEKSPGQLAKWHGIEGCCGKCQPPDNIWWQIPGSVWCGWDRELNRQLSDGMVEREFWITIRYYEEGKNGNNGVSDVSSN